MIQRTFEKIYISVRPKSYAADFTTSNSPSQQEREHHPTITMAVSKPQSTSSRSLRIGITHPVSSPRELPRDKPEKDEDICDHKDGHAAPNDAPTLIRMEILAERKARRRRHDAYTQPDMTTNNERKNSNEMFYPQATGAAVELDVGTNSINCVEGGLRVRISKSPHAAQ